MPEQIAMTLTTTYTAEESAVWAHLRRRHGRDQAITRAELCFATGLDDRSVRAAIASLISVHQCAIGSRTASPGGYYRITDPDELRAETGAIVARLKSLAARLRALHKSEATAELLGQIKLLEDQA